MARIDLVNPWQRKTAAGLILKARRTRHMRTSYILAASTEAALASMRATDETRKAMLFIAHALRASV